MHATLILGLLLVSPPASASTLGWLGEASAPARYPEDTEASELARPLSVDGVPISELEVQRLLIYGKGRPALEWRRVNALIDDEIARRVAEGADPARYEVDEEAFQRMHDHKVRDFKQKYPTLDLDTEISRTYASVPWYERELLMEMRFDAVFVQDDPEEWPEVTFEALREEAGEILIDDFRESYERRTNLWANSLGEWEARKAAGEDVGPEPELPHEDSMYRGILRQIVKDALMQTVDTRTALDGLPPHLVATMDLDGDGDPEHVWTTEELWADVRSIISEKDISDARLFLAKIQATRHRMEREGILISPEEVAAALKETNSSFQSSPFSLQSVVVGSHQFPSLESYAQYFALLESWKRHLEPQLQPSEGGLAPELTRHLDRANRIMGLGKVESEVLLVGAFDFPTNSWIDDGWSKARERADWLKSEYDANVKRHQEARQKSMEAAAAGDEETGEDADGLSPSEFWSLLLDEHCDYWDPPPAASGPPGSNVGFKQKGRFGERYRNDLESLVGESPFLHFLYGSSITDHLFFEQEIGTVTGPMKGPMGYYLTRVTRRMPPSRPLNLHNEKHVELLRDDYVRHSLIDYAEEALQQAEVTGL